MQIISKKVKISTNFWEPNFLNPLCDNGYGAIVRFSENRYIFLKKTKNKYEFLEKGTIFWKRYIFLESTIFWQDKVHFSGKGTFFWHSPKGRGASTDLRMRPFWK